MNNRVLLIISVVLLVGLVTFSLIQSGKESSDVKIDRNDEVKEEPERVFRSTIVYSPEYGIDLSGLEKLHPFDIHKYKRIYDQLVADKMIEPANVKEPEEIPEKDILRVHSESFLESLKSSATLSGYLEAPVLNIVPAPMLDRGVLKPFRFASGGTLLASRLALEEGISINIGGGYHHAKPEVGEGFCIYADMPISIRVLQDEGKIKRALVIDLDVHQGNGTILCLADDETTFCFSMHQEDIYPTPKEKGDLDIELETGMKDVEYLETLEKSLDKVFQEAGKIDLVIYQAGCDTLKGDPLASLDMSEEGIVKRDQMVVDTCVERKVPVVMTLGGGYSEEAWHVQYSSIKNILELYEQANLNATESKTQP